MAKTFEELKQMAIQIRDEKANKQNTATRIGTQMVEHLNKLEQEYYNKENIDEQKEQTDAKFSELEESTNTKFSELEESTNTKFSELEEKNNNDSITFRNIALSETGEEIPNTLRGVSNYFFGYGLTINAADGYKIISLYKYDKLGNWVGYDVIDNASITIPNDGYIHRIGIRTIADGTGNGEYVDVNIPLIKESYKIKNYDIHNAYTNKQDIAQNKQDIAQNKENIVKIGYNRELLLRNIAIDGEGIDSPSNTRVVSGYFLGYGLTLEVNEGYIFSSLYKYDKLGNWVGYNAIGRGGSYTIPNDGYIHRIGFAKSNMTDTISEDDEILKSIPKVNVYDVYNTVSLSSEISSVLYYDSITFRNIALSETGEETPNTLRGVSNYFLGYGLTINAADGYKIISLYKYDKLGNWVGYDVIDNASITIPNDGYIHRIGIRTIADGTGNGEYVDVNIPLIKESYKIKNYDIHNAYETTNDVKLFDTAVYIGDSIASTYAIYGGKPVGVLLQEWGIIGKVEVLAVPGASILGCKEQLDKATIDNPDIVFASTGVNSWSSNGGIGEWFTEVDNEGQTEREYITTGNTIKAMYMNLYQYARSKYPNAKIVFTTVIKKADNSRMEGDIPVYSPSYLTKNKQSGLYLDELRKVVLEMPLVCNVYAMDMWQMCGLDPTIPEQLSKYFYDKTHPSTVGHIEMTKAMVGYLKTIIGK